MNNITLFQSVLMFDRATIHCPFKHKKLHIANAREHMLPQYGLFALPPSDYRHVITFGNKSKQQFSCSRSGTDLRHSLHLGQQLAPNTRSPLVIQLITSIQRVTKGQGPQSVLSLQGVLRKTTVSKHNNTSGSSEVQLRKCHFF